MPRHTKEELRTITAKARLLGCTHTSHNSNGVWNFYDAEGYLRMMARPQKPVWMGKAIMGNDFKRPIASLRKKI